jgi:hypothetical protein
VVTIRSSSGIEQTLYTTAEHAYNWIILDRLMRSVQGYAPGSTQYRWALRRELKVIAGEISEHGSDLNLMVRFPG